jgi:hypothetical protein
LILNFSNEIDTNFRLLRDKIKKSLKIFADIPYSEEEKSLVSITDGS